MQHLPKPNGCLAHACIVAAKKAGAEATLGTVMSLAEECHSLSSRQGFVYMRGRPESKVAEVLTPAANTNWMQMHAHQCIQGGAARLRFSRQLLHLSPGP